MLERKLKFLIFRTALMSNSRLLFFKKMAKYRCKDLSIVLTNVFLPLWKSKQQYTISLLWGVSVPADSIT